MLIESFNMSMCESFFILWLAKNVLFLYFFYDNAKTKQKQKYEHKYFVFGNTKYSHTSAVTSFSNIVQYQRNIPNSTHIIRNTKSTEAERIQQKKSHTFCVSGDCFKRTIGAKRRENITIFVCEHFVEEETK